MFSYIIVFLGAGVGGAFRHATNQIAAYIFGIEFPFGTVIVNVVGSFFIGVIVDYYALCSEAPQQWKLFLVTGILGGFTTFSAFSLDTVLLYQRGESAISILYALGSVLLSITALYFGTLTVRYFCAGVPN